MLYRVALLEEQDRVDDPLVPSTILFGVNVQERPVDGVLVSKRLTIPVKLPFEATTIMEVVGALTSAVTFAGLALRSKPGVVTITTIVVVSVFDMLSVMVRETVNPEGIE